MRKEILERMTILNITPTVITRESNDKDPSFEVIQRAGGEAAAASINNDNATPKRAVEIEINSNKPYKESSDSIERHRE